jgi:hypothetical protein
MAAKGRRYVLEEYSWPVVLNRMAADLEYVGSLRREGSREAAGTAGGEPAASQESAGRGQGRAGRVLLVGTYPPIPRPAADATVAAAGRSWDSDYETTVVSPRLSAADLMVPVCGLLAGIRLERIRLLTSSERVVLVIEEGFPFVGRSRAAQLATAAGLRRALRRFRHVTLVVVGHPSGGQRPLAILRSVADEVLHHPAGGAAPGVTPLGPAEATPAEKPAQLAASVARRVLGRHADPLRAWLGRVRRQWRSRLAGKPWPR